MKFQKTRNFILFSIIFISSLIALDEYIISKDHLFRYFDIIRLGFEIQTVANTLHLEGLRLFIGVVPLYVFGSILIYIYNHLSKSQNRISLIQSFSSFFHFLIAVMALNLLGGIAYYICSIIPWIKDLNEILSKFILIRVYVDLPLVDKFEYTKCYIDFSFANLAGLFLLRSSYFKESLTKIFDLFQKAVKP